jgi:hypothetical protein
MIDNATYGFNRSDTNALLDLISTNDIEHEEIKPLGSGVNVKLFKTPSGGIGAASGDGSGGSPYVWGSATCTEIDSSGVLTANTYTVKNIVTDTIGGNVAIKAILVGSDWIVDVASCP